jgi:hypothetical protein
MIEYIKGIEFMAIFHVFKVEIHNYQLILVTEDLLVESTGFVIDLSGWKKLF